MIILPTLTTSLLLKADWENVHFELGSETVKRV